MDVLTAFQKRVIRELAKTPIKENFFLTGGTALSAFYLKHRLSEDLDFFTEIERAVVFVLPVLQKVCQNLTLNLRVSRQFETFMEVFISSDKEILRCDFAQDSPYRLKPKEYNEELGIYVDNCLDISCNKLSALFDRSEAKDFVDIYFLDKKIMPFSEILKEAKKKHIGVDEYWLAISFQKINDIVKLPVMLKPLDIEELKTFYQKKAKELMSIT
jgi:predicted nucleotidyltransferase component of viral defense system